MSLSCHIAWPAAANKVSLLASRSVCTAAPAAAAKSAPKMGLWLPFTWLTCAALVAPFGVFPDLQSALDAEWARSLRGLSLASVGVGSYALAMHQGLPGHLCFLANGAATIAAAAMMAAARHESYSQVVKRALTMTWGISNPWVYPCSHHPCHPACVFGVPHDELETHSITRENHHSPSS